MKQLLTILTAVTLLTACSQKRKGEIVMDKNGNFYELTTPGNNLWPTEAYRLHEVDTTKYIVRGFVRQANNEAK